MEITTMTSKSGKTKYWGIEFKNGSVVKIQSRVKATQIINQIENIHPNIIVSREKGNHCSFLLIDGVRFGRISKKDYQTIQQIIEEKKNAYFIKHQNTSLSKKQSGIQLRSNSENVCQTSRRYLCEILPETSKQLRSGDDSSRSSKSVSKALERVPNQQEFIRELEAIDRELRIKERSDCELTRRVAGVRRGQFEIALEQREIAIGQQEIAIGQREVAIGIEDLKRDHRDIQDGIEDLKRNHRDIQDAIVQSYGLLESIQRINEERRRNGQVIHPLNIPQFTF